MTILMPPTFRFEGYKEKSKSLKAQALQFYNFVIKQAELGGISNINKSLVLSDGSTITIYTNKDVLEEVG